ncbi:hypothetical protein ACEPPN_006010 [Leptodophora sp. 'Broadleaf-Isolate-01']
MGLTSDGYHQIQPYPVELCIPDDSRRLESHGLKKHLSIFQDPPTPRRPMYYCWSLHSQPFVALEISIFMLTSVCDGPLSSEKQSTSFQGRMIMSLILMCDLVLISDYYGSLPRHYEGQHLWWLTTESPGTHLPLTMGVLGSIDTDRDKSEGQHFSHCLGRLVSMSELVSVAFDLAASWYQVLFMHICDVEAGAPMSS